MEGSWLLIIKKEDRQRMKKIQVGSLCGEMVDDNFDFVCNLYHIIIYYYVFYREIYRKEQIELD